MKKSKWGRIIALVTAFAMVFALALPMQVQAGPTGDVVRVELTYVHGSLNTSGFTLVAGNEYTFSFWMKTTGAHEDMGIVGAASPWPYVARAESPSYTWVWHEHTFEMPEGQVDVEIVVEPHPRVTGSVYYVSAVTVTAADGTVRTILPGSAYWVGSDSTFSVVPAPDAPSVGGPVVAAPAAPGAVNPPTGDFASNLWLLISGIGLVASLSAVGVVVYKKKK